MSVTDPAPRGIDRDRFLLALDTATSHAVVIVGDPAGRPLAHRTWEAGHRHGDDLLPAIQRTLSEAGVRPDQLGGIVVGTGPGAFTGLRVGLATAKALAQALELPIVGVSTAAALLAALELAEAGTGPHSGDGRPPRAVLLPAGPNDRVLVEGTTARLLRGSDDPPDMPPATALVAVDLAGRAPEEAVERGSAARRVLPEALLAIGAGRIARGERDDLARLVPEYVTLPRGVGASSGEVSWSRAHR